MKKENKINLAGYLKYSFAISIIIIIIILSIFVYFLYKNVYETLTEAQEVTSLRKNIISEKLEKEKFSEIILNMEKKIALPDLSSTTSSTLPIISSSTLPIASSSTVKKVSTSSTSTATSTPTSTRTTSTHTQK